jgi:hypothetical protein
MVEELVTQLIDILKNWAKKQTTKEFIGFYLFGSLINENGNQFLRDSSDIDLIVILSNSSPLNRARLCQKLQKAKLELELLLLPILQRKNKTKPIVSLVLVTENEVTWDIHKEKSLTFFRDNKNKFLNLLEESDTLISIGLDNREALADIIQALEKAQDYRNKYLSLSPNKSKEENEQDTFPKELARSAAQINSFVKNKKGKFDISLGNSYLIFLLKQKVSKVNNEWSKLNKKVADRNNGRCTKKPALTDFDLLLLYELLFDKAYKLLKQNSSINRIKGGQPARVKGNPPAPPAAKVQSKKRPEAKTKSKSSTVARERGKTTSADPAKPATAKKKTTTPRKTPVSKNSTTCSSGTVKSPKDWVMLNEKFFRTESIKTQQDRSIVIRLLPTADMEQVAALKSLHPEEYHSIKQIAYTDQCDAGIMQVLSALPESSAGKTRFNITLRPTQNSQNSGFPGISYDNYSADEITRLARIMLLGGPLPKDLERLFPTTQIASPYSRTEIVKKGIFPELWVKLQAQPRLFLPKAWLKAVYSLKMNGIVEDVLELELGPIKNKVMRVRFRGRRRQAYANQKPIEFEESCTLGE